jgi:hypothetical protein
LTCIESDNITLDETSSPKSILKVKTQAESEDLQSPCSVRSLSKPTKKVDFQNATVQVHIHAITLGDNPSVRNGPPVSLDWKKLESITYKLEDFFLSKDERRRTENELLLPKSLRRELLLSNGFAQEELRQVERQMKSIRKSRKINSASVPTTITTQQRLKMILKIARLLKKSSNNKKSDT